MSGPFDDLIPSGQAGGGAFDDLIPQEKPKSLKLPPRPIGASSVYQPPMPAGSAPTAPQPDAKAGPEPKPWSDLPGNILPSAGNFVSALVQPILHPVDTANAIGDLAGGVHSKMRSWTRRQVGLPEDADRAEREAGANAFGGYLADRYGGATELRNTAITDPVGLAADAATILSGGALLPGKVGQVAGTVARAIDPVNAMVQAPKLAARGAEAVTSNALGVTTGAGKESVRAAARAGMEGGENAKAFTDAMRGNTQIEDTVATAKSAVDAVRKERSDAYKAGMADLSKDRTVMDFAPIDEAVTKASEVGSFKGVTVEPKAQGLVTEMRKTVDDWKALDPAEYHTPEGIDALKRTLGNIRDSTLPNTPERVAADRVYNAVRAELTRQAPDYAKTMEAYAQASERLKEVTKTLSLGEKATGDTAGRKLLSATRNNAQTNYGQRVNMIEDLARYEPTLPYAIAGHAMNSLAPQGVIGRGGLMGSVVANPANVMAAPFFSPRLVGEGAYYAGKAGGMIDNALELLRINEQNVRRAGRASYQGGRAQQEAR